MARKVAREAEPKSRRLETIDLGVFSEEIKKTGFVLENRIAQALKKGGWTVISNKYYVDDFEQTVREIDLLAYRVNMVDGLNVYTVLIISCKKSEESAWALLAREVNLKDPNSDWWPLHAWSNDKVIQFQASQPGHSKAYHDAAMAAGVSDALSLPQVEVFAFQEMDRKTGAPRNDKAIFQSVSSLVKAQAYELGVLPRRKKAPCVYQFNLLSVVDADLLRLMFGESGIICSHQNTEHYFARHIIGGRETFARVRFMRASVFEVALNDYAALHNANCDWVASQRDAYFADPFSDWRKAAVLEKEFLSKISFHLRFSLNAAKLQVQHDLTDVEFNFSMGSNRLMVCLDLTERQIAHLNCDQAVLKQTEAALKNVYRFSGAFEFESNVPF